MRGLQNRGAASATFMIGRVFASGARLFTVAIPFSMVIFGDIEPSHLVLSILSLALVATIYTSIGGIRAVIWTDVLQAVLIIGSVVVVLLVLTSRLPLSLSEIRSFLSDATVPGGSSRGGRYPHSSPACGSCATLLRTLRASRHRNSSGHSRR